MQEAVGSVEYYHLVLRTKDFTERKMMSLLKIGFPFSSTKLRKVIRRVRVAVEKNSLYIRLRREDTE